MSIVEDNTQNIAAFTKDDWEHVFIEPSKTPSSTRDTVQYPAEDEKIVNEIHEQEAAMVGGETMEPTQTHQPFAPDEHTVEPVSSTVSEEMHVDAEKASDSAPEVKEEEKGVSGESEIKAEVAATAQVDPIRFKKGQRVMYRYANGTEEEMRIIGVHHDDFPNIYYTIQQLKAGPDGEIKEKQTDATHLTAMPPSENPDSYTSTPVTGSPSLSPNGSRSASPSNPAHPAKHPASTSTPAHSHPKDVPPKEFHAFANPHPEFPNPPKTIPISHPHTVPKTQHPIPAHQQAPKAKEQPQQQQQPSIRPPQPPKQQHHQQQQQHPPRQQHQQPQARQQQHVQQQPEKDPDMIPFSIQVAVSGGRPAVIPGVYPGSTIGDLKHYLSKQIGLPQSLLQIVYNGYIINDSNLCMQELGITHGSKILVERVQQRRTSWY